MSTSAHTPVTPTPQQQMMQLLTGTWIAQGLYAAALLGIADLLKDGPRTPAQLAEATKTNARALYRLLRALASVDVFTEHADGTFGLTPLATCLQSDVPGSQRPVAIMMGEEHYGSWGELLHSLETGKPAFDKVYGQPIFQYLAKHATAAQIFDAAMTGVHGAETRAMLDGYDFAAFGTLVDVGGGNGSLLIATLERYPRLQGVLYDRPDVIERARANVHAAGLEQRCKLVGGSFFDHVPPGGDAYLMRHIIHDWNDEQALTILRHCRKAMRPAAKLLLVECVIPPGNEPFFGKWLDVNMLVIPGGQERTEQEYRELYKAAGFTLTRIVPTTTEVSVIEGVPSAS
jgi:hypothetical protein